MTQPSRQGRDQDRLERERSLNMRQLLLRAARSVNRDIVEQLRKRGYDIKATHTTLLSNLPLAGASVTEVAERAGITKQAMGRLAVELEEAGYLTTSADPSDGRQRLLRLTKRGRRLMLESFEAMDELEASYGRLIGSNVMAGVLAGLSAFVSAKTSLREEA